MSESFPRDVEVEAASAIVAAGEFEAVESAELAELTEPTELVEDSELDAYEDAESDDGDAPTVTVPRQATAAAIESVPAQVIAPTSAAVPTEQQVVRHIVRAEALAELGRRQEALDVLNGLIVEGAEDVRIWRALAQIHLDLGEGDKALRAADWVVTFHPDDEWGYRLRSSALKLLQRPEEAVAAAERAVELAPEVWQGQATLALALHSTGDLTAAAEAARKASALAAAPEAKQVAEAFKAVASAEADGSKESAPAAATTTPASSPGVGTAGLPKLAADTAAAADAELIGRLESAAAGSPSGLEDESLQRIGNLVLRALEFSAGAGWLVSFGGIAIPSFNLRFLIPIAVLIVLSAFLYGPARKAGRDIWRYLAEYMWRDPKTRTALIMAIGAHVWMIAGSSVGHVQGGSALTIGLLTHLAGRSVLAKKAPELNPVKRSGKGSSVAGETAVEALAADVTSATA